MKHDFLSELRRDIDALDLAISTIRNVQTKAYNQRERLIRQSDAVDENEAENRSIEDAGYMYVHASLDQSLDWLYEQSSILKTKEDGYCEGLSHGRFSKKEENVDNGDVPSEGSADE